MWRRISGLSIRRRCGWKGFWGSGGFFVDGIELAAGKNG